MVAFLAALVAAVMANDHPGTSFSNMLIVDGFATFFRVLVIGVGILTVLSSAQYLKREHAASAEYYALLLFSVTGQCVMATANELIMIFIGLEISSIATYILAGYLRDDKRNNEAALKYFLLGSFATAFLLYGIAWIYGTTGSTNLADIRTLSADAGGTAAQRDPGRHRGRADVRGIRLQSFRRAIPDLGAGCLSGRARAGDAVHVGRPQGRRLRRLPASLHDGIRAHHRPLGAVRLVLGAAHHDHRKLRRADANQHQAPAGLQLDRARRLRDGGHRRAQSDRHRRGDVLSGRLRVHEHRRIRRHHAFLAAGREVRERRRPGGPGLEAAGDRRLCSRSSCCR